MQFSDITDANGTALQTYAEMLQEKAHEAGLTCVLVFAGNSEKYSGIHTITNIKASVPEALIQLGEGMQKAQKSNLINKLGVSLPETTIESCM